MFVLFIPDLKIMLAIIALSTQWWLPVHCLLFLFLLSMLHHFFPMVVSLLLQRLDLILMSFVLVILPLISVACDVLILMSLIYLIVLAIVLLSFLSLLLSLRLSFPVSLVLLKEVP